MKKNNLTGNLLLLQLGGPTAVFNYTAYYLLRACQKIPAVKQCFGAACGLNGLINNELISFNKELSMLTKDAGSYIGSSRIKLSEDFKDSNYEAILQTLTNNNIRFILVNGGNDSMDTASKLANYLTTKSYQAIVLGVPKTIDNDLGGTDFSLGFPSAMHYINTTLCELGSDFKTYPNIKQVNIIETMGRHAGWLALATRMIKPTIYKPDLVYVPELNFSLDTFKEKITTLLQTKNIITVVVSEGIKSDNELLLNKYQSTARDAFGHSQLGGVAQFLSQYVKETFKVKSRAIELSLMQRCAHHLINPIDILVIKKIAKYIVTLIKNNVTNQMPVIIRTQDYPYRFTLSHRPLAEVANYEKVIPPAFLSDETTITPQLKAYLLPFTMIKK